MGGFCQCLLGNIPDIWDVSALLSAVDMTAVYTSLTRSPPPPSNHPPKKCPNVGRYDQWINCPRPMSVRNPMSLSVTCGGPTIILIPPPRTTSAGLRVHVAVSNHCGRSVVHSSLAQSLKVDCFPCLSVRLSLSLSLSLLSVCLSHLHCLIRQNVRSRSVIVTNAAAKHAN